VKSARVLCGPILLATSVLALHVVYQYNIIVFFADVRRRVLRGARRCLFQSSTGVSADLSTLMKLIWPVGQVCQQHAGLLTRLLNTR
jgi:hypothetical protein